MSAGDSIGRMDKRIALRSPNKLPDGAGGQSTTWGVEDIVVWAEEKTPSYKTAQEAGAMISELNRTFRIRIRSDVRKGWQVVVGGKTLKVSHVYNPDKSNTVVVCREVDR